MSRPQHTTASRARLASAALGLGAVLALTGCSAGQVTQTDTQVAAVNGGSANAGNVGVRNAMLTFPDGQHKYPAGSSAPMEAVLINSGAQDDELLRASSSFAQSVQIGQETSLPAHTALHALGDQQPPQGTQQRVVSITLQGFTQDITPGVTIPVTFEFAKAGPVTVQVPIDSHEAGPRPEHGEQAGHSGH